MWRADLEVPNNQYTWSYFKHYSFDRNLEADACLEEERRQALHSGAHEHLPPSPQSPSPTPALPPQPDRFASPPHSPPGSPPPLSDDEEPM
jgi:hypothetical protein